MKQIIIIGTGKAAMLHYRAYCMFVARENIFFIDPYFKQSNDEIIVFSDVEEALEKINSSKENIIVDICTPCSEFINLIKKCKDNGLYSIVVEKPFIIDNNALNSLCDGLNLVMIQNYLYSEITKTIKKIITENNLNIIKISKKKKKNISEHRAALIYATCAAHISDSTYSAQIFFDISLKCSIYLDFW